MTETGQLYKQVTEITEEYLGPAAERFIARQISFHLHKTPRELTVDDLPKLIEWSRVTLGLLTEDKAMIVEFSRKISNLAKDKA